jgi:L-alanine-DL-glutamate epimerase-like enolase superfamily enzyme
MRITNVVTTLLTGPLSNDPFINVCAVDRSAAFVEIHTDEGITGYGETYAGYFCPDMVPPIVEFFRPILIGQNVDDVDELWQRMYHCGNFWCRVGLGASVLTGIEAALWDLKGKLEGKPVHELLGGAKHHRLDCYATGGPANYPKDQLAAKVEFYLSLGFRALKVATGSFDMHTLTWSSALEPAEAADFEADKVSFIRSVAGDNVGVAIDGHMGNSVAGTWELDTAQAVADALAPFDILFLEEPLHYNNRAGYTELCRKSKVRIAGGECLTTAGEWREFLDNRCFHLGQPDAAFVGGLGEFMRIARMLDERGLQLATHAWGAGGCLMQNVHAAFASANTLILEVPPAMGPLHSMIIDDDFRMENGQVVLPERPGLGITLTDEVKQRFPFVKGSGEFNDVPGKKLLDRATTLSQVGGEA